MFLQPKRIFLLISLIISALFANVVIAKDAALYFDFNAIPVYQLTDKISLRFVTGPQFTVIQWNLKAGAKLPVHSHMNEQVTRVLEGDVEVHTGEQVYKLHAGNVMIFPPNVTHGFTALTDTVMYEQQTPVRQDFLQEGFVEKLSAYLKQNQ